MKPSFLVTVPSVEFAGRRFELVPAVLNEEAHSLPRTGVNIGIGLLQPFVVTFDYSRNALYLSGPKSISDLPRERAGVRTELDSDHLNVAYVSPHGPAGTAGVKAGDVIVAIDGKPIRPNYYSSPEWSYGTAGRTVQLLLKNGTRTQVKLADYY